MNIDITLTEHDLKQLALEEIQRRYGQSTSGKISDIKIEVQATSFKAKWEHTFNLRIQVKTQS